MLTIQLSEFMMQLKEGAIHNIGPTNKSGTVKLYDVERATGRAFGDGRVKLVFEDDAENTVEVAVVPDELETMLDELESVRQSGAVDGFTTRDGAD